MTPEQAIQVMTQVAAAHVGNRRDHEIIEAALKCLAELAKKDANEQGNEP